MNAAPAAAVMTGRFWRKPSFFQGDSAVAFETTPIVRAGAQPYALARKQEDDRRGMPTSQTRRSIVRDAIGIGITSAAYAMSFGALSTAAGLTVLQTCALSVLMFTGASQFAFISVATTGGTPMSAAATAILLGVRNSFYGLRLASLLGSRGARRLGAAQFVIDETTAMAVAHDDDADGRFAYWATGFSLFVLWNLGTLIGALGGQALEDPGVFGLDVAPAAAYLALVRPQLKSKAAWLTGAAATAVALALVPVLPVGVPVMVAGVVAVIAGTTERNRPSTDVEATR